MAGSNWVIDNLNNALQTWNKKLSEIWLLVTQSPTEFKGGSIWNVVVNIHGALQATGLGVCSETYLKSRLITSIFQNYES
jgi:hypothetical protein